MWTYEKKLQYPVNIKNPNPAMAKFIITQFGGPDGELAASQRYLAQRYSMYGVDTQWEKDAVKALKTAFEKAQSDGSCVVICGSLYLAGEVLTLLHGGKLPFLSNA